MVSIKQINKQITQFLESADKQKAYHGSNVEFDKFDLSKFQRGDYGYGVYLTTDKTYAGDYGKVKEYEIPGSDYLLQWDVSIEWSSKYIQEAIDKLIDDLYEKDEDAYNILFEYTWNYCNTPRFVCGGSAFYYKLGEVLNMSEKSVADYLYKYGIKGTESDKGNCYCIFNPSDITLCK